jgi:hypothetical protein
MWTTKGGSRLQAVGKRPLEIPKHSMKDNNKLYLKIQDNKVQTGLIWLRRGASGSKL